MKKLKTRVEDKATLELIWQAHHRASLNKAHRSEILKFNLNEQANLVSILDTIRAGTYRPSSYRSFWVHDPKLRLIKSLPYPDRIVHQWAVEEFYKPYYFPRFIKDSYACIDGRGAHAAVDKAQEMLRALVKSTNGQGYILKMDISKFFNNIDQQILFNIISRVIADPSLNKLTASFIFDQDSNIGIPIGNYTSQIFVNIYLNELDKFIKEELRVKRYIRYMDDFVLFVPGQATAKVLYGQINDFVNSELKLHLNPKSRYYPCYHGLDFAGFRIFSNYRLLRRRSKKKLKMIIRDYRANIDNKEQFCCRVNSWYGHANSYRYINSQLKDYRDILPVVFPSSSESSPKLPTQSY